MQLQICKNVGNVKKTFYDYMTQYQYLTATVTFIKSQVSNNNQATGAYFIKREARSHLGKTVIELKEDSASDALALQSWIIFNSCIFIQLLCCSLRSYTACYQEIRHGC